MPALLYRLLMLMFLVLSDLNCVVWLQLVGELVWLHLARLLLLGWVLPLQLFSCLCNFSSLKECQQVCSNQ
jgi:hypothetical protein